MARRLIAKKLGAVILRVLAHLDTAVNVGRQPHSSCATGAEIFAH